MLETKIDKLVALVRKYKSVTMEKLAQETGIPPQSVEILATHLEKGGVLAINYPVNVLQKAYLTFKALPKEPASEEIKKEEKGRMLASYSFYADGVPATVEITDNLKEKRYDMQLVELSLPTRIFLDQIKDDLLRLVPAEQSDVSDVEKLAKIKGDFTKSISGYLERYKLGAETTSLLTGYMLHAMFGLGELDVLNQDNELEEIAIINSSQPVGVYHRKHGWLKTNIYMPGEDAVFNYASQIARRVGRQISVLAPILDARLETGDRVNATLAPISSHGNTMTIRRFARNPWTIVSFLAEPAHTMSAEMAAMLWQALHYEMNVIIAGGTGSGKTSALNTLAAFIPPNQRIITIEDTRELMLPTFQWNWVPLLTRNANAEGLGEVTMLDLMVTSLRMRPDRILLGEMRTQREAEVLFEAMHTGHSVYSTIHADTAMQMIRRLTSPPMNMPPTDIESVHLAVVQYRDRRKNLRRTLEICEIIPGAQDEALGVNVIYRWRPRGDTFDKVGEPTKFLKELNLHTGMTKDEILADQKNRALILKWMVKNKLDDINSVGKIMSMYYSQPQEILEVAKSNLAASKVV